LERRTRRSHETATNRIRTINESFDGTSLSLSLRRASGRDSSTSSKKEIENGHFSAHAQRSPRSSICRFADHPARPKKVDALSEGERRDDLEFGRGAMASLMATPSWRDGHHARAIWIGVVPYDAGSP
jgi:hypothetical protein